MASLTGAHQESSNPWSQHTLHDGASLCLQEQEALVKELTEVLQRRKTRVAALQKDRADMAAQLAAYQPAEQDRLRAELGTLRERVGELAGIKVVYPACTCLTLYAFCPCT